MARMLVALLALIGSVSAVELHNAHQFIQSNDLGHYTTFAGFAERYNRKYADANEVLERFQVYKSNTKMAQLFATQEQGSAVFGETPFMDMTVEEFRQTMLPQLAAEPTAPACKVSETTGDLPASFDWRQKEGVVTAVKNQGSCGSCWAFSVVGNIEGQWRLRKNQDVVLSEQELLDCDFKDQACNGGHPIWAYEEIERLGGLETEKDYPYHEHKASQCSLRRERLVANITSFCQVEKNEETIKRYLVEQGPLSIGVNAFPLQFYRGGIHYPFSIFCSKRMLNHAVLLVGYGEENGQPYWIIKNSWSERWGEQGYYRLYRGNNVCGVTELVTTALVKN